MDRSFRRPIITGDKYDNPNFWESHIAFVQSILPEKPSRDALLAICKTYECGDYETAMDGFRYFAEAIPASTEIIWPYMLFCEEVIAKSSNRDDIETRQNFERWKAAKIMLPTWIFEHTFKSRPKKVRCKYCARFTAYIDPDEGVAYLGMNQCSHCQRSYSMPSLVWDSVPGQAYIFYRRSVNDVEFFQNFVKLFDVRELNNSGKT